MIISQLQDKLLWNCQTSTTKMRIPMIDHKMYSDGTQKWYQSGKLHRTDGPAIIRPDGSQEWWLNGKRNRIDGPAIIRYGTRIYYQNSILHRTDGPAIIHEDGNKYWYLNGKQCEPFKITINELQFNIKDGF